ncbi:hypothetical protein KBB27_01125 [Patescibacteria group bacterium]|nr:hypothetical protein [Patescibacteria group bacterium]
MKKLAFLMFCVLWASVAPAQNLGRLAPPVPAVHRPPTRAQALCDQMTRYAAAHADVPLGVRTPERVADFDVRDPLQVVALRRWAEQDLVMNGGTQPAAYTQAQRMPIATIVARLREAWRVPADRQLRFNWSLAFERETWCDATTVRGHEPTVSQAVDGSLQASFCFVSTGRFNRAPHECGFWLVLGQPRVEVVNLATGRNVDTRADDAFGYGGGIGIGIGAAPSADFYGR